MKIYYITSVNGKTAFEPREAPKPQPKAGEILVKVKAASLNRGEILASITMHKVHEPHPAGADCAGEVEAVGEGVTQFKPGDRIIGRARGSFAEYVAMSAAQAAPAPKSLSWEHAASLGVAAITAYEAIVPLGRFKSGETLLVAGAASGVGVMAVQIGKYLGGKVIGLSRSKEKLDKLKGAGLDVGIQADGPGFVDQVLKATDGNGANLALNLVGGGVFPDLLKSLANQGRLAIIGYVDDKHHAELDLEMLHGKRLQVFGVSNTRMSAPQRAEAMKNFARDILPGYDNGKMGKPVIDKVYPFDQLREAKAYVETNAQLGKVVVKM